MTGIKGYVYIFKSDVIIDVFNFAASKYVLYI